MKTQIALLSLLTSFSTVIAAPFSNTTLSTTTTSSNATSSVSSNPCAVIATSTTDQIAAGAKRARLKPSRVFACLQDVAFNQTLAVSFIDWFGNFIQFQSTLSYLKNPPPSYALPPVDVIGELASIRSKAESGQYNSHYDFEYEIGSLIRNAHDGHLQLGVPLIGAFAFDREVALVSISANGSDIPKVYFKSDFLSVDNSYTMSPVTKIDLIDVDQYLVQLSFRFQDPDALYNDMFFNPVTFLDTTDGAFPISRFYSHSDFTTYTFANGTSFVLPNSAIPRVPLDGIQSGQDLFDNFVLPSNSTDNSSTSSTPTPSMNTTTTPTQPSQTTDSSATASMMSALGFPKPIVMDSDFSVAGYFLPNAPDTAVLSILQFVVDEATGQREFQSVIQTFLAACRDASKTRLIIDLRGNPGGSFFNGYDTFKQLFPTITSFTKFRFRAHAGLDALGQIASQTPDFTVQDVEQITGNEDTDDSESIELRASPFALHNYLRPPDGPEFTSWEDLLGPQPLNGDNFTNPFSVKFSDEAVDVAAGGIVVSGYANLTNLPTQLFDSGNITVITDSRCSSTCGLFSNLLFHQANVKSVVFGGRPSKQPMVAIGGTQGAQVISIASLQLYAAESLDLIGNVTSSNNSTNSPSITDVLTQLIQDSPMTLTPDLKTQNLNLRDNLLDDSDIPLQFRSQSADCRVFYTGDDLTDVSKTWEKVAIGDYVCVDGGKKAWEKTPNASSPRKSSGIKNSPLEIGWLCIGVLTGFWLL